MPMIEPKYYTLNGLLSERVFRIPCYQRFYSWEEKQCKDLFGDIKNLLEKRGENHHFMATIVCYRTGETKPVGSAEYKLYEIVDGQQRITTLVILLKAIEMQLSESEDKKVISKMLVKADGNLLLLQTNNANQYLFNNYLRDGSLPKAPDIKTHADMNLNIAIEKCKEFIDEWVESGRNLTELLRLIRNRIGFVVYDTDEEQSVYSIFENLNSRGLEVDWLDKCKNAFMGIAFNLSTTKEARHAKIEELHSLWGNIYSEIAKYPIYGHEIIRVTATLHLGEFAGKPLSAEDSLEKLKKECDIPQKTVDVSGWLYDVTKKLVELNRERYYRPVARIFQARMLFVALMLTDSLSENERNMALDQWERVTFRIYGLYDKDARHKVGDYIRLATNIMKKNIGASSYEEIMQALRDLGKDFSINNAAEELRKNDCYSDFEQECRYILWRYEEHLAEEEKSEVNVELREKIWEARVVSETIEHIFPQNPEDTGSWQGKLKEGEKIDKHVHRIGNLLLLPPRLNNEAGNKSFEEKKKIYKKAQGLRMVQKVIDLPDWNQDEIEKRESEIIEFIKVHWNDLE